VESSGLARWHEFFVLAGTAGATLVGLLFVSVSLNTEIIMRSSEKHLRAQAMSAFESLLFVMILSLIALAPIGAPRLIGTMLIMLGLIGAARAVGHVAGAGRGSKTAAAGFRQRRLILPVLAHVIIAWSGVDLLSKTQDAGFKPLVATLWLLITATRSAWELLVEVGEAK